MENLIVTFFAQAIFFLYPAWQIYKRAGLNPMISLTVLIPNLGVLICALILVFSKWQVQPKGGN